MMFEDIERNPSLHQTLAKMWLPVPPCCIPDNGHDFHRNLGDNLRSLTIPTISLTMIIDWSDDDHGWSDDSRIPSQSDSVVTGQPMSINLPRCSASYLTQPDISELWIQHQRRRRPVIPNLTSNTNGSDNQTHENFPWLDYVCFAGLTSLYSAKQQKTRNGV
jgi:hypothetical protein